MIHRISGIITAIAVLQQQAIQLVGQQIIIGRIHCRQMQTVVNM